MALREIWFIALGIINRWHEDVIAKVIFNIKHNVMIMSNVILTLGARHRIGYWGNVSSEKRIQNH